MAAVARPECGSSPQTLCACCSSSRCGVSRCRAVAAHSKALGVWHAGERAQHRQRNVKRKLLCKASHRGPPVGQWCKVILVRELLCPAPGTKQRGGKQFTGVRSQRLLSGLVGMPTRVHMHVRVHAPAASSIHPGGTLERKHAVRNKKRCKSINRDQAPVAPLSTPGRFGRSTTQARLHATPTHADSALCSVHAHQLCGSNHVSLCTLYRVLFSLIFHERRTTASNQSHLQRPSSAWRWCSPERAGSRQRQSTPHPRLRGRPWKLTRSSSTWSSSKYE